MLTKHPAVSRDLPHVQPRVGLLGEVPGMVAFFFTSDDELTVSRMLLPR
jgi:hypothetical protein